MTWKFRKFLKIIKKVIATRFVVKKPRKMSTMKRRRESVASVYRKTTKFLSANTASLLKRVNSKRKYRFLTKVLEEYDSEASYNTNKSGDTDDESDNLGERDLEYYLGVRKKETYWRDPVAREQIRRDFLVNHCGVSEDEYDRCYKIPTALKVSYVIQPKLKQVPFKIHKKNLKENDWREKTGLFKLFRKDSMYSTSESYSEYDSNEDDKLSGDTVRSSNEEENIVDGVAEHFNCLTTYNNIDDILALKGVRIKEVSEGRPCDNCPELCPGFIPHAWRKTCKSCGCDRLTHSVYHEELGSVRERLGLRESRVNHSYDSPPGLTAKQTELYWTSLAERAPTAAGGATGSAAWRAWRTRALADQLPKQDLSLAHCRHIDEAHRKQFEDFVSARNEIALDIGIAQQHHGTSMECMGCTKPIRSGSIAIQAPRLGEEAPFHPSCFACSDCGELLVDLAYCALDGRLYCVRHYDERLKPRCYACDEVSPIP